MTDDQIRAALELLGWRAVRDKDGQPIVFKGKVTFYWTDYRQGRWLWLPAQHRLLSLPEFISDLPDIRGLYARVRQYETNQTLLPSGLAPFLEANHD